MFDNNELHDIPMAKNTSIFVYIFSIIKRVANIVYTDCKRDVHYVIECKTNIMVRYKIKMNEKKKIRIKKNIIFICSSFLYYMYCKCDVYVCVSVYRSRNKFASYNSTII